MILNKIFRHFREKKIFDLKYIVVEIALIFAGITLAAKYNNYQNELKDEIFLEETIRQIYDELKKDSLANYYYWKGQTQKKADIETIKKVFLDKDQSKLNSQELKNIFLSLPNTISISNIKLGYQRLSDKNINLIKNNSLKRALIEYHATMDYNAKDVEGFNMNILEIKPFISKHFRNYVQFESYDAIIDPSNLMNDDVFLNYLNFIKSDMQLSIDTYNIFFVKKNKKLINDLEQEYPFLKEE